jgi:hypothetical protein
VARDMREEMLEAAQQADEAAASRPLGPQLRILQCFTCRSMEELPDYPTEANPADDVTLHYVDRKHGGDSEMPHHRTLLRVEQRVWEDRAAKRQIVEQAWSAEKGFTPSYYDIKATLQEDAVNCHRAHMRQVPCIDWRDPSKRLTSPTARDRQQLARELPRSFGGDREAIAHGGPQQYLCDYCPVSAAVEHAKRKARGEA